MNDSELYKELGKLTKDKSLWEESIPFVSSLLAHESAKIKAKALWLLGEMGLAHPGLINGTIPAIAAFLESSDPLLIERAVNALGRIGRADFHAIEPYWEGLFRFASDENAKVRLIVIWASENIATNTPDVYEGRMPELVTPYVGQLREIAETDENRVVRVHCLGAIRATSDEH